MIENSAPAERLAAAQERRTQLTVAATRLQKLSIGLTGLALSPSKAQRLRLLKGAKAYLARIKEESGSLLAKTLATVSNELESLTDGVRSGEADDEALVPVTTVSAVTAAKSRIAKLDVLIAQLQAGGADHADHNEKTIERNREFMTKLPNPKAKGQEFAIGRMPIAFTFQNKQGHSSVGYVSPEALDMVGFKVENVAGYTIIHNQMVIGVNSDAIKIPTFDKEGQLVKDEQGRVVTDIAKIKEVVVKFKAGKPVKVAVRRPKTLKDVAMQVIKELNRKTRLNYELVSQNPAAANGAGWFWVMPAADIKRLAKAMPGNHVGIAKWGFAS